MMVHCSCFTLQVAQLSSTAKHTQAAMQTNKDFTLSASRSKLPGCNQPDQHNQGMQDLERDHIHLAGYMKNSRKLLCLLCSSSNMLQQLR